MSRMKTRAVGLAAVAVLSGAAFAPAVASAAPADINGGCVASSSPLKTCTASVSIGSSKGRIVVTVKNAKGGSVVRVYFLHEQRAAIKAGSNGRVTYTSKTLTNGYYGVVVKGTSQNRKSFNYTSRIHVTHGNSGSASGGTSNASFVTPTSVAQPAGGLAFTGAEIGGMSILGLGLVGGGASMVLATRRRRNAA